MATTKKVDIDLIIPVYNALEDVQHCIASILVNMSHYRVNLIIVNDASEKETTDFLRSIDADEHCITLLENEENKGYARTANIGLNISSAPYVILMNSDIIVSKNWLQNLIACAESDSDIGIVSPVTNAAIWQSVPFIPNNPAVGTKNLPTHKEVNHFSNVVKKCSYSIYPRLPYIHGFCQFIKREVIDAIGHVDEQNFPNGLGSEQDYCYRAADAGFLSVIADDTFIYHSKAKSLKKNSRKFDWELNLNNKYGEERHKANRPKVLKGHEMNALRMATTFELYRSQLTHSISQFSCNICVLVNSVDCIETVDAFLPLAMTKGYDTIIVRFVVKESLLPRFFDHYNNFSYIKDLLTTYQNQEQLINYLPSYDVVICSDFKALDYLREVQVESPEVLPVCYIGDREFFEGSSTENGGGTDRTDLSYYRSVLFLTESDSIAKAIIQAFGVHVYNLNAQDQEINWGLTEKLISFFNSISLLPLRRQSKVKMLLRLLKDAVLYHRRNQNPVAFSKGKPSVKAC